MCNFIFLYTSAPATFKWQKTGLGPLRRCSIIIAIDDIQSRQDSESINKIKSILVKKHNKFTFWDFKNLKKNNGSINIMVIILMSNDEKKLRKKKTLFLTLRNKGT